MNHAAPTSREVVDAQEALAVIAEATPADRPTGVVIGHGGAVTISNAHSDVVGALLDRGFAVSVDFSGVAVTRPSLEEFHAEEG